MLKYKDVNIMSHLCFDSCKLANCFYGFPVFIPIAGVSLGDVGVDIITGQNSVLFYRMPGCSTKRISGLTFCRVTGEA